MPSHTENFGIVVTEALAQGPPAIASTGTPWQILEDEGAGWWTRNDPEHLAACLARAMALTAEEYDCMSANAARLASERFDIHARVGEWELAYATVLAA